MSMSPWCVDRSMARAAERCQVVERGDAMVTRACFHGEFAEEKDADERT